MDKHTLSHYGWIVVLVLILSVLLAFMTPLGNFVADGIKAFTGGFISTNNEALDVVNPGDSNPQPPNSCLHENIELKFQKDASCSSNGYTGDKICKDCGTKVETGKTTDKLMHTSVADSAIPATCEQKGKTAGSHCSICNTVLVAQTEINALGHDWGEPFVAEEATCLGSGISRIECKRDGCDAHKDTPINSTGHTIVTMKGKAATCTATGLTDGEKCSICGTVTKAQTTIKALGHNIVKDNAVAATCTKTGLTEGEHCTRCSHKVAQTTIPMLNHQMSAPIITTAPTCTADGYQKIECTRSGCDYEERSTINKTGHKEVTDSAVPATCTGTGKTEGKHCSVCGVVTKAQTTTSALGHNLSTPKVITNPTCTTNGQEEEKCMRTGCSYVKYTTLNKTGHKEVTDAAVPATCVTAGKTEGSHCSACGTVIKAQTTIPMLNHQMSAPIVTTAPTCTADGYQKIECTRNGCDYEERSTINKTGHKEVTDNAVPATCLTAGKTEGKHCSVCGAVTKKQTTVAALGHTYNSAVTKTPTCTEEGIITYICVRNDHSYTETIPALGHIDTDNNNDCDRCGDIIKEVPGLGDVEVDNPDIEITYDPDTGDTGGIIPPADDEEDEPFDIPEEEIPETITVNYGKFESNTKYTPGQYATVEYIENIITVKQPVDNSNYNMAWWTITKDSNGNIISTVPESPMLSNLPNEYKGTEFSNYIVYSFDDTRKLEMNNVKSSTVWFAIIENEAEDTLENAIYLAAVAQRQRGFDVHIAKWNGTQYVDQGKDAEVDGVTTFTTSTPVTKTKQVLVSAPTSTTTYTYVPVGTLVAEKGMTWREWLASDYNTTGETAPTIKTADFEDVSYDDVIVAGENYGFYQQTSEYTLSGVWTFVDVPDNTTKMVQELSFTSCGVDFAAIEIGNYEGILYFTNKWETYCSWNAFMDEWEIDGCNTVDFGSEPQAVSQEFYEWFTANANPCLSGKWVFDEGPRDQELITLPTSTIQQAINFTYGQGFTGYTTDGFYITNEFIHYGANLSNTSSPMHEYNADLGWEFSMYLFVDFGTTPQAVSKEFYEWFTANAKEPISFEIYDQNSVSTTHYALEGMTWAEWVNSKYNLSQTYYISGNSIMTSYGGSKYYLYQPLHNPEATAYPSSVIQAGVIYRQFLD